LAQHNFTLVYYCGIRAFMRIDPIVINGHRKWPWSGTRHMCFPSPLRRFADSQQWQSNLRRPGWRVGAGVQESVVGCDGGSVRPGVPLPSIFMIYRSVPVP